MTLEPVVSMARAATWSPDMRAAAVALRVASAKARMWSSWLWVAWSGSSFFRCSGYSATPEPRRPRSVSTMVTRTLKVPKSTPATIAMKSFPRWIETRGCRAAYLRVRVHVPAEIASRRLMNYRRDRGEIRRHVMLKSVFADVMQKLLHVGNLHHACAAKCFQWIIREAPFSGIAANLAGQVIRGEAGVAHGAGFDAAHASPESIFLPHRAGDDRLKIHLHVFKEMLRQIAAVKAHGLIGIAAVVVVPVKQSARRLRSQLQRMHTQHAADVDFARARDQRIAHHAHHGARHDAKIFLERSPALHRADLHLRALHPIIDYRAEFGHFEQRRLRNPAGCDIALDVLKFFYRAIVRIFHPADAPNNL